MIDDAVQVALALGGILERLGVPYMIGGSLASITWSEPRFTQDVDFVAALEAVHVDRLLAELEGRWYADEVSIRAAIERRSSFNLIELRAMIKVDVFVPGASGLHAAKWSRVRRVRLSADSAEVLPVTSPEDILLQKLDWYRAGDCVSEQQWRDVCALLRIRSGQLDEEYLDSWAERMDLQDLLARARREVE